MIRIPDEVVTLLDAAAVRVRRIFILRGLAVVVAVFLAVTMVAMGADAYFVIFDDTVRYAISGGVWLTTLVALFFAVWWPFRNPVSRRKAAKVLDERHPENEERLTTLVELAERDVEHPTSPSLYAVLAREGAICAHRIDLAKEFTARTILKRLAVLGGVAALLLLSFVVFPNVTGLLFVRAAFPWVDVGNVYSGFLAVQPGSVAVLKGTTVEITARKLKEIPGVMTIRISRKLPDGSWGKEFAEPLPESGYRELADLRQRQWRYRVSCGPAVSKYYTVRVCEMPRYRAFTAKLEYPAYTGRRPVAYTNENVGAIQALAGTRVTFALEIDEPGTTGELRLQRDGGMNILSDSGTLEATMVSNLVSSWSMQLTSADGFKSPRRSGPFVSVPDQTPTIVIESPKAALRLPQHAKLPISYTASDDVGLGSLAVIAQIGGQPWQEVSNEPVRGFPALHRGIEEVDLTWFDLAFANRIAFRLIVTDRWPAPFGGPHAVTSTPVVVEFQSEAKNFEMQSLEAQMKTSFQALEEAARRLESAERAAQEAKSQIERDRNQVTEQAEKKVEKLAHEVNEAEKRAEELAEQLREDGKFDKIAEKLENFVADELAPLKKKVEESQFADPEARKDALDKARPMLREARDLVKEAEAEMKRRGERLAAYEKTKDLADRQEALAKAAEKIVAERPVDAKKLEAWKRMEEAAAKVAADLARNESDPEVDEARRKMERAAEEMKDFQRELELANAKNLTDEQKEKKRAEYAAAEAAAEKKALEQAKASEQAAAEALAKAAARREAARAATDANQKRNLNAEAENFERTAASQQRQAEDALSRAGATEEQRAAQAAASEKRRAASEASADRVEALKTAELAQQQALAALDREAADKLAEKLAKQTPNASPFVPPTAEAVRASLEKALKSLKNAEEAGETALDALRAHDAPAALEAQKQEDAARAEARAEHPANALDAADAAAKTANDQTQRAKNANNDNEYRNAVQRQEQALEALRAAEDAIAEELGTPLEDLEEMRAAEAAADRIREAQSAAEQSEQRALEALKRDDRGNTQNNQREADRLGDKAEGLIAAQQARAERAAEAAESAAEEQAWRDAAEALEQAEQAQQAAEQAQDAAAAATERAFKSGKQEDREAAAAAQQQALQRQAEAGQSMQQAAEKMENAAGGGQPQSDDQQQSQGGGQKQSDDRAPTPQGGGSQQSDDKQQTSGGGPAQASDGKDARKPEDGKEAEQFAKDAAEDVRDAAKNQAAALGIREPMPDDGDDADAEEGEKDDDEASQGAGAGKKKDKKSGGGSGKKRDFDKDAKSLGGGATGVDRELEKLAKELKRNDIPEELKGKLSRQAWFRIRGSVKEGLGERDLKNVPAEYRDLVRRYFLRLVDEKETEGAKP